jgi:hypothetical protein
MNRTVAGNTEGKKPIQGLRHRWEDNIIKLDITEIGLESVVWIHLAQEWTAVNTVMSLLISIKCRKLLVHK